MVRNVCFCGIEIWGWEIDSSIEAIQNRFFKWAIGWDVNTPGYLVRAEAGRTTLHFQGLKRIVKYVLKIRCLEETRYPKICWREMIRRKTNGESIRWMKVMEGNIFEEYREDWYGRGELVGLNLNKILQQELDNRQEKICKSKYCPYYKFTKSNYQIERYLTTGKLGWAERELARVRLGNGFKGGKDWYSLEERLCVSCKEEEDSLEHVLLRCKALADIRRRYQLDQIGHDWYNLILGNKINKELLKFLVEVKKI